MSAHRKTGTPFPAAPRGTCKWCGQAIVHGRVAARSWHDGREDEDDCLQAFWIANDRLRVAWHPLAERDGTDCQTCGVQVLWWHERGTAWGDYPPRPADGLHRRGPGVCVDHVVPIIDGGDRSLANLQILCPPCHRRKTGGEAAVRARRRAGQETLL